MSAGAPRGEGETMNFIVKKEFMEEGEEEEEGEEGKCSQELVKGGPVHPKYSVVQ